MAALDTVRYVVAAAFTLATGLFPVTAALRDEAETRTDFTWDMFAVARECASCSFTLEVGGQRQRLPWGLRGTPETLDPWGRGALLAHPRGPALNLRTPVQVARVRHGERLTRIGAEVCAELETIFEQVSAGTWEGTPHRWMESLAARWSRSGGQIGVYVDCSCRFDEGEHLPLVDAARNLCASATGAP